MKSLEEKLRSLELREPPAELKKRVLENATVAEATTRSPRPAENRLAGTLLALATSKWFLFLLLPLLCIGSIGALAVAIEERGADDRWEAVRAMLEDEGESLDFESFFAPHVPDEENFMATPALKGIEFGPSSPTFEGKQARFNALPGFRPSSMEEGERIDFSKWEIVDSNNESLGTLGDEPEAMILKLLEADAALFEELAAAAKRPFSQPSTPIGERLAGRPLWELTVAHFGILQQLAKVSSIRALAAARTGDREMARESLEILFKCRDCALADGLLLNGLVGSTIRAILEARLPDLLRENCWTDDDLRWLQNEVAKGDGFEEGLRMFRAEMAGTVAFYDAFLLLPARERIELLKMFTDGVPKGIHHGTAALLHVLPDGFYHRNKATSVQWTYQYAIKPLKARDVRALWEGGIRLEMEQASVRWLSLGAILASKTTPMSGELFRFGVRTEMHRRMMEAGVALERYRRARGEFPTGLEQLVPDYLERVPEDLGAPEPGTPVLYTREGDGYRLTANPVMTKAGWKTEEALLFIR